MGHTIRGMALSLLMLFLFGTAVSSVSAQVLTQQPLPPAGDTKTVDPVMIADVNIYDATIVKQTSNAFQIFFKLSNGKGAQSDIHYAVQLSRAVTVAGNRSRIFADEKVYPDSVSLDSDTTLPEQLTYEAPAYLTGTYDLTLMSRNANGLVLGFSDLGEVTLSGTGQYVEVKGDTCFLTVEGESGQPRYTLFQGVDIDPSETLDLTCTFENHTKTSVTLTPSFATFLRSTFGQEVAGTTGTAVQAIALKASEQKAVTVSLPKATVPQAYDIVASFTAAENVPVTSVPLHYVLRGIGATINNLVLDKIVYAKGDTAQISFVWMGPADNFPESRGKNPASIGNISSLVRVADASGTACGEETKTPLDPNLPRQEIGYAMTADCLSPQVDAQIVDANGKVLATAQFRFRTPEGVTPTPSIQTKQMTTMAADNSMTMLRLMVVALALIAVLLGILIRKGKGTKKSPGVRRPPGVVLTFLLVGFSVAAFAASAQHAAAGTFSTPYGWYANGWVEFSYNNNSASIGHGGSITGTLWASNANCFNHLANGYTWGSVGIDGGVGWVGLMDYGWNGWNISNTYSPGDGSHNIHYGGKVNLNESFQDQGFYVNPLPSVSIWADTDTVSAGQTTVVHFRSSDAANGCYASSWDGQFNGTYVGGGGDSGTWGLWGNNQYSVTCYNGAWQSTTASTMVYVVQNPDISWFYPETNPVDYGGQSVLNWNASNASYCYLYGGIWGSGGTQIPCSGRSGTGGLYSATGYWFAAYNSLWVGTGAGTTVYVNPAPTVSLSANPTSVVAGGTSMINISSSYTSYCRAWSSDGQYNNTPVSTNGSAGTWGLSSSTTYQAICWNSADVQSGTATVTVNVSATSAPTPTLSINNSHGPLTVSTGTNLNITWSGVSNATSCTAAGTGWTGGKAVAGGSDNLAASTTSTYTLSCTGPGGTGSDSVTVNVSVPSIPSAVCGPAEHTYPGNATGLSGALCGTGSYLTSTTPVLPSDATPVSWTCQGAGGDTTTCTASRTCATNCPTQAANYCGAFVTVNSCGITENCSGAKTAGCNITWQEVAP